MSSTVSCLSVCEDTAINSPTANSVTDAVTPANTTTHAAVTAGDPVTSPHAGHRPVFYDRMSPAARRVL